MDRAEWLALRREGIGASDIAAAAGLWPATGVYATALEIYEQKLGLRERQETESMAWGTLQEPSLAKWYEQDQGCRLYYSTLIRSPDHPWILATPDRERTDSQSPVFVELKTSRRREGWGEPGTDLVPIGYLLQAAWQMMASAGRAERVDICATICGAPPVIYPIQADASLFRRLHAIGAEFWGRVLERRPPEPDWTHPDTPALVQLLHRPREGTSCILTAAEAMLADDWEDQGTYAREAEETRKRIHALMAQAMGDASEGMLPDGRIVSRKVITVAAHERKESTQTRMTIRKGRP